MKLRFLIECRDKYTGEIYKRNSVHDFEEKRANELLKTRYVEKAEGVDAIKDVNCKAVEEAQKAIKEEKEKELKEITNLEEALADGQMVNLNDLSFNEIRKLAKEEGVSTKGKKEEIIERIMAKHEND